MPALILQQDPLINARTELCNFINPELSDEKRLESRNNIINLIQNNALIGFYDYIKHIINGSVTEDRSIQVFSKVYALRASKTNEKNNIKLRPDNLLNTPTDSDPIFGFKSLIPSNQVQDESSINTIENENDNDNSKSFFIFITTPIDCCKLLFKCYTEELISKLKENSSFITEITSKFNYVDEDTLNKEVEKKIHLCDADIKTAETEGDADKAEALRSKATVLAELGLIQKSIDVLSRIGRRSTVDSKMFILLNSLMRAAIALHDVITVQTYLPQLQSTALNLGFEQRSKLRICEALCFLTFPRLASTNRLLLINFESDKSNAAAAALRKNSQYQNTKKATSISDTELLNAINTGSFSNKTLETSIVTFVDPSLILENILLACERLVPSIATFSAEEYISYDEFIVLMSICLTVVAPRQFMLKAFDGMTEAKECLKKHRELERCFNCVIKCRYDDLTSCVYNLERICSRNPFLFPIKDVITRELRRRTYEQFLSTYKEVNIEGMAMQFNMDTEILLNQLETYMQNDDLHAKINLVDNTVMCVPVIEATENVAVIMDEANTIIRKLEAIRKGIIL